MAESSTETRSSATLLYRPPAKKPTVLPAGRPIIVTIDGPAGTGKSSVARTLAARLGLDFLDTGAMYRAAAAVVIDRAVDRRDEAAVVREVEGADVRFDWTTDPPEVLAWGRPMGGRIRAADVTQVVSPIAGIGRLRELMVRKQREIARAHPRLVTEGRDQGSVVFPQAAVKFYLDASPEVRCRRRAEQLRAAGVPFDEGALYREIVERDRSDSSRADGPLICPEDAERVDTSGLDFEQVVTRLERLVLERVRAA
jgi:cytidylate kinase